jgi:hypothetical protein
MPIQIKETEKANYIKYNRGPHDSMGKIRKELENLERKSVSKSVIFYILALTAINAIETGFLVKLHDITKTANTRLIVALQPAAKKCWSLQEYQSLKISIFMTSTRQFRK